MSKYVILSRRDVEKQTSMSRTSIYRLMGDGQFPKPIRLSPNRVGWLVEDIDNWLQKRISDSQSA